MVDRIPAPDFLFKTDLGDLVTGVITKCQGLFQRLLLPEVWQKFYFQGKIHRAPIRQLLENVKLRIAVIESAILPPLNTAGIRYQSTFHHFLTKKKEPAIPPRSKLRGFLAVI